MSCHPYFDWTLILGIWTPPLTKKLTTISMATMLRILNEEIFPVLKVKLDCRVIRFNVSISTLAESYCGFSVVAPICLHPLVTPPYVAEHFT
jgi:hypothetical protein